MTQNGSMDSRQQAITLLADMGIDPRIDQVLRELLNADDFETRIEAYEALLKRGDPSVARIMVVIAAASIIVDAPITD